MFGIEGFSIFSVLFRLFCVLGAGVIVARIIGHCLQWNQHQQSPQCTVYATVASKRTSIIYLSETDHHHISKRYFVSFETANGDQMEFRVAGPEYRMMAEGDEGMLSFQGTLYLEFEIKKQEND
ncbi:MAG: DUF2500 domain-containing protein [Erysipelotrichaceae bacterium]|nr:DUF2500 domain-containing protein [Erysipelotrichaceae bacterium]